MIPHTGAPKSPLGVAHRLPITAQPIDLLPRTAAEDDVIRIALIEDDNLMREWLGRSLTTRGYKVERFRRAKPVLMEQLTSQTAARDARLRFEARSSRLERLKAEQRLKLEEKRRQARASST